LCEWFMNLWKHVTSNKGDTDYARMEWWGSELNEVLNYLRHGKSTGIDEVNTRAVDTITIKFNFLGGFSKYVLDDLPSTL
jgi:hypothetical protein